MSNLLPAGSIHSEVTEPQPLFKEIPPSAPFPMNALGEFADTASAIQRIIKEPDAICGQSVLAGLAQIAQAHADISIDGRRRPISCFFASVGETGERKSAVDEVATWPHRKHERELEAAYKESHAEWKMEFESCKQARDDGMKKAKTQPDKMRHLKEMGEPPIEPPLPVVLVEEPTYEGLIKVLQYGLPSIGLFTDEGGRFVGGHALNSENALKTAAGMSSLWDSGEAKRTRLGDGHISLHGKRVSMHLMLQGVVAEMLMGNDIFREQGWLTRMLISWPESTVGNRMYVEENIFSDPAVKNYHAKCLELLDRVSTQDQILDLPIFELSQDAKRLWVPFHDYCNKGAASGGELEAARGFANKAPEHAARLAGVLAVMKGSTQINTDELASGIEPMNYYLNEAIRIADSGQINQAVKDAAILLKWLQRKNHKYVYPALVYQKAQIGRAHV